MARGKVLKTIEGFVDWATSIDEERRFKPKEISDYDWKTGEFTYAYLLEETGTSYGFRGMTTYRIPNELGKVLYDQWGKNKNGTTIGARKMETILAMLEGIAGVSGETVKATIDQKRRKRKAMGDYNIANYYYDQVQRAVNLLEQAECKVEVVEIVRQELAEKSKVVDRAKDVLIELGIEVKP